MKIPFTNYEMGRERAADVYVDEVVESRNVDVVGIDGIANGHSREMATLPTRSPTETVPTGAVGSDSARSWYADVEAGGPDVNPELMGREKYEVYWEMKLTDPAVRSLVWLYKLPIRSADHGVAPAKNDPHGDEAAATRADFLACQFGLERHNVPLLDLTFDELNQQDLLFLDYGAMGGEINWGDVTTWVDEEGDPHIVRPIARIAPRSAATTRDIEIDERTGRISRARQDVPGAEWIPGDKFFWLINEREGTNWWGQSILRSAYGPWKIKKGLWIATAIGWDRYAVGVPKVRHPPGEEAQRKASEMGRNIRTHERSWVTLPGLAPEQGGEWDVDIMTAATPDPTDLLRYFDYQIAVAGLEQFSQLGTTERGARAVGEVLESPFYEAVQAVADYVRLARMRQVVRRLWDVNFGADVPIPELTVSKIQGKNISVLTRAVADLSAAGFNFTDRDTQNDVRDQLDLRHLPDAAASAIEDLPEDVGVAPASLPGDAVPGEGDSIRP